MSGHVGAEYAIIANPDVSAYLERGLVVYSIDAKCDLLGLDRKELEAYDGVSARVVTQMAVSLFEQSNAPIALATTGFAGPRKGDEEVGLVHFAIALENREVRHFQVSFGDLGRETVCRRAVQHALLLLTTTVKELRGDTNDSETSAGSRQLSDLPATKR